MQFYLNRYSHSKAGTFGLLIIEDRTFQTVEQDWENNQPNISCIPNGTYEVVPHTSPKYGDCYILINEMLGVGANKGDAKRWGCLFHSANLASQLQGCIAPGLSLFMLNGELAVGASKRAMKDLSSILGGETHTLVITSNFPSFEEEYNGTT